MEENELLYACINSERSAWEKFLKKYSRFIYNYIYYILKARGRLYYSAHVEDLFNGIILSLMEDDCRKLRSFSARHGCKFLTWLRVVTINSTIDQLRRERQDLSMESYGPEIRSLLERVVAHDCRSLLSRKELLEYLSQCVAALGLDDKFFLELHLNQGIDLGQLRAILKTTRGAVDMRKARIMGRLKDCFRNKGVEA